MPSKKKIAKKTAHKKTLLEKVSATASHIKDEIVTGKDHVVEFAGETFDSIKEGVKHLVQKKKPARKKSAKKVAVKRIPKKSAPKKSVLKKAVKKSAKKIAAKK